MDVDQSFKYVAIAVTGIGLLSSAISVFRRWWIRGECFPRVGFNVEVNIIDEIDLLRILEVVSVYRKQRTCSSKIM